MAYYYVKHDGTATGDNGRYASIQSSSFATLGTSGYYSDIYDAINTPTTAPTSGDYILCSDLHNSSGDFGGNISIPAGVSIISVDDTDGSLYKPGANEDSTTGDDDYTHAGNVFVAGVSLKSSDNTFGPVNSNITAVLQDCTITSSGSTDRALNYVFDGTSIKMINVEVATGTGDLIYLTKGSSLFWDGGSTTTGTQLFNNFGFDGGATACINGVDLSSITTLLPSISDFNDNVFLKLTNCQLNSGVTLPSSFGKLHQRFEMYGCDDSTGDKNYRFYIADYAGTADNNDSTYVTNTEAWFEGSDKSSIEVTTTANCSHSTPFVFELPAQYVDLSQAASDVLTLDIVTDSTALSLTDTDIAAFLVYPDGTTATQANWVTSGKTVGTGNYGIDPLAAGTALSASSLGAGDWTGEPASANFYKMELDTSGDAGQATAVSIRIEVYKASIASGDLFIHPLLTLS